MPLISQRIDNLLNGVSEAPIPLRLPSQAEEQINGLSSPALGLTKRPPTRHVAVLDANSAGYGSAFVHTVIRNEDERYRVIVAKGTIRVFDADTGAEYAVLKPSGTDYLTDESEGFRAVQVGDSTILINRSVTARKGTRTAPARPHEALVYVRQADFSTRYAITLNKSSVSFTTVDGTDAQAREKISTDNIAKELYDKLVPSSAGFTLQRYGSTIYIARTDGAEFTVSVEDGLGDKGLKAIKGSIQRFDELPYRAPDGFLIQVAGAPESEWDDYYVVYDADSTPEQDGVWREAPKPEILLDLNAATLPHRLERAGPFLEVKNRGRPTVPKIVDGATTFDEEGWEEGWDTPEGEGTPIPTPEDDDDQVGQISSGGAGDSGGGRGAGHGSGVQRGITLWIQPTWMLARR
jgi:hypothetical protein